MVVEILQIDQGKTVSETSEGLSLSKCETQRKRLVKAGGRFVIFPTLQMLNAWRHSVEETL